MPRYDDFISWLRKLNTCYPSKGIKKQQTKNQLRKTVKPIQYSSVFLRLNNSNEETTRYNLFSFFKSEILATFSP